MQDSSKLSKADMLYDFDAMGLLLDICNQHQIEVAMGAVAYFPKGWKVLLLDFLNKLKQYPVVLIDVIDTYGQLDIKFEMKSEKDELHVWRLIDSLRMESRNTCMECGLLRNLVSVSGTHPKICEDCYKASRIESTGTWLDRYE